MLFFSSKTGLSAWLQRQQCLLAWKPDVPGSEDFSLLFFRDRDKTPSQFRFGALALSGAAAAGLLAIYIDFFQHFRSVREFEIDIFFRTPHHF
jgi:hypothetical protein